MFRSLLFISAAAIFIAVQVLAVSHGVQAGGQGDAQKRPIIRSTTRVMTVNVVVTDRQARPVQGLTKDDFQILDNGQQEKIAFFSTKADKNIGSHSVRPLPPGEYSNDPHRSGMADGGATILLFDTVNSAYPSQAYGMEAIRVFLNQLQPEDRMGIYILKKDGLKVVYDPGQPAGVLLGAVQRYDATHHGGAAGKTAPPAVNTTLSAELDHFLWGKDTHQPMNLCDPQRYLITIAAFQEIARSIAGIKGRKAVVWFTEHPPLSPVPWGGSSVFDLQPGDYMDMDCNPDLVLGKSANLDPLSGSARSRFVESGNSPSGMGNRTVPTLGPMQDWGLGGNDELDLLIRLFTQNDIVIYPVSAEGLQTLRIFGPGGAAPFSTRITNSGQPTTEVMGAVGAVANVESHQKMDALARRTGGRAFYNRNDLETELRRALDDGKYGYELAYYPDSDHWKGDWRKIEVKVNRPGVTVLARSGYFAFPEPKLLPPKASKQLLEEIAASPLEDREIPSR
jgi:VWFA-related protein